MKRPYWTGVGFKPEPGPHQINPVPHPALLNFWASWNVHPDLR
jgi:hypothetical protein